MLYAPIALRKKNSGIKKTLSVVGARSVTELAATLTQWAGDAALRAQLGAAARTRAEAMFREDRMVAQTLGLVEAALSPSAQPAALAATI
jgi:glycosyltransferase involved in cell wall biosynthesis